MRMRYYVYQQKMLWTQVHLHLQVHHHRCANAAVNYTARVALYSCVASELDQVVQYAATTSVSNAMISWGTMMHHAHVTEEILCLARIVRKLIQLSRLSRPHIQPWYLHNN